MTQSQGVIRQIGLAGQVYGVPLNEETFKAECRQIRKIIMMCSGGYFLPDGVNGLEQKMLDGRVDVHRTSGQVDGFCCHQSLDVRHRPYGSSLTEIYRVNEIRTLAVLEGARREKIAQRLVREAQLKGTIFSPHDNNRYALRAVATVAAIHEQNDQALGLAESLNATITPPEGPVIDSNPALRAYAIECFDRVARSGKNFPFVIAILRSVDLFEAAKLSYIGRFGDGTYEGDQWAMVEYDYGGVCPEMLMSAVDCLALRNTDHPRDVQWIKRLGLEDGPDTAGEGTAFYGNVTAEMKLKIAV